MVVYGLLSALGTRGGLMLGFTVAEILASCWKSRHTASKPSPRIYFLNRRIHHGEIGTLLALASLFMRGSSIPTAAIAAILTGMGIGLVKDDVVDITDWFKLKKKKDGDQKHSIITRTVYFSDDRTEIAVPRLARMEVNNEVSNNEKKSRQHPWAYSDHSLVSNHKGKPIIEKLILEPLQNQIRDLVYKESQTMRQVESKINQSRKYLLNIHKKLSL
jgi:hypothetical protein